MKKIILATLLIAVSISLTYSQSNQETVAFRNSKQNTAIKTSGSAPKADYLPSKSVSAKALKDFSKWCNKASDCRWYSATGKGSIVFYQVGEKKGRRSYDQKGNFVYNILTYGEESLPVEVRDLIKRTYYQGYQIDLAQEVETIDKKYFVVNISDDRTIKILSVFDGEVNELNNLTKSR